MNALLFGAQWVGLTFGVLLTGAFLLLLLAGPPQTGFMRIWEARVATSARWLALAALASGAAAMAAQTALFENRLGAALDPQAILSAILDTHFGFLWLTRHSLLILLTAFLLLGADITGPRDWIAARSAAFVLAALALVLPGNSGHLAASSESLWPQAVAMAHLLGAGVWAGGLPPLALLLYGASRNAAAMDPCVAPTVRRFSRAAAVALLILAASGVASGWLLIGGAVGLFGTPHGWLLLAKLAVLVPALLLAIEGGAMLPGLSSAAPANSCAAARRMALLIAIEAVLVLIVLGFAAAMTMIAPAIHDDPVWPWRARLSLDALSEIPFLQRLARAPIEFLVAGAGLTGLAILFLVRRRPLPLFGTLFLLISGGAAIALQPLALEAYPTSFAHSQAPYSAASIAEGMAMYESHCVSCHGTPTPDSTGSWGSSVDLLAAETTWRSPGDLFWLITHGRPERGMPEFGSRLREADRWDVINFLHALTMTAFCSAGPSRIGPEVRPDSALVPAPDIRVSVGRLTLTSLRDLRGKRMALLVLYDLPRSRARMAELAKRYGALSVQGVEVIAAAPRSSPDAIADLGQSPSVLFPVVTDGNEDVAAAYRLFAPGAAHAEFLIDRRGYIRAIWRSDQTGMPDAYAVQTQVEKLNEEKPPPPLPDDHIH
jgi:putative copper export protein/mono/diheme cytochrome c family protein/peroxiredoxin